MKHLLILLISLSFFSCSSVQDYRSSRADENFSFSVLQGPTDETSTVIRVVLPKILNPTYLVTDENKKPIKVSKVREFKNKEDVFKVIHLFIDNLKSNSTYELAISVETKKIQDIRTFKTLKLKDDIRVLVASCASDQYNEIGNIIWPKAFSHNPDVTFLIGDNVYADIYSGVFIGSAIPASPNHLWKRFVDHAMAMKIYRMKKLVPTYAVWDDHDYGVNDGDSSYKYKKEAKDVFQAFFPSYNNVTHKKTYGVGAHLSVAGQQFHFLDGRSFRSSRRDKNGHHIGQKQTQTLLSEIKKDDDVNWLILGDQFHGGYHKYESFEGLHPKKFKKLKQSLVDSGKKFYFLTGDRHLVEVIKVKDLNSIEYTVSGVHTRTYPGALKLSPNPNRLDGFDGTYNYGIFDINRSGKVHFKAYSIDKKLIDRVDKI